MKVLHDNFRSHVLVHGMQTRPGADQAVNRNLLPQIPALQTGFNLELTIGKANPTGDVNRQGLRLLRSRLHGDLLPLQKFQPVHNIRILIDGVGLVQRTIAEIGVHKRLGKCNNVGVMRLDVLIQLLLLLFADITINNQDSCI